MRNKLKKRKPDDEEKGDLDEKTTKDASGKRLVKHQQHMFCLLNILEQDIRDLAVLYVILLPLGQNC